MTHRQDKVAERAYYDRYGPEFEDAFPEALYERWFRIGGLWETAPAKILEAACGAGHFGHRLAQRGHQVTGVDLSHAMVGRANTDRPAGFTAIIGDIEDPGLFLPQRFDVIFFGQALHHFPDMQQVLTNCGRWLTPGGRLVLIEPNGSNPINALGKWIGRVLALHPAMQKTIGTVNEVSLPVGRTIRALRRHGFVIDGEQMETIFPGDTASAPATTPPLLRFLGAGREALYKVCVKLLPPRWSGIQFILVARKPEPGPAVVP